MSLRTIIVRIVAFPAVRFVLVAAALTAAPARPAEAQTYTPCASTDARVTVAPSCEPGRLGTCDSRIVRFPGDAGTSTEATCSTNETGSGTFVFHSPFPPGPIERQENAIAIKHGNSACYGALVGQLPACDCSVPAEAQTWGRRKFFDR